jgi:hypothetical protein
MDPLNKLPHSFFAVNTAKTRFVYLAYDVAPKYYGFARLGERQGHVVTAKREMRLHGNSIPRISMEICAV